MQSTFICFGWLQDEPKLIKGKEGYEFATFNLMIKRNSKKSVYDVFRFIAHNQSAKYIMEYIHKGDCVSINSRPKLYNYKKKDGSKAQEVVFVVKQIDFICKKPRLAIDKWGASKIEEMEERFN